MQQVERHGVVPLPHLRPFSRLLTTCTSAALQTSTHNSSRGNLSYETYASSLSVTPRTVLPCSASLTACLRWTYTTEAKRFKSFGRRHAACLDLWPFVDAAQRLYACSAWSPRTAKSARETVETGEGIETTGKYGSMRLAPRDVAKDAIRVAEDERLQEGAVALEHPYCRPRRRMLHPVAPSPLLHGCCNPSDGRTFRAREAA